MVVPNGCYTTFSIMTSIVINMVNTNGPSLRHDLSIIWVGRHEQVHVGHTVISMMPYSMYSLVVAQLDLKLMVHVHVGV